MRRTLVRIRRGLFLHQQGPVSDAALPRRGARPVRPADATPGPVGQLLCTTPRDDARLQGRPTCPKRVRRGEGWSRAFGSAPARANPAGRKPAPPAAAERAEPRRPLMDPPLRRRESRMNPAPDRAPTGALPGRGRAGRTGARGAGGPDGRRLAELRRAPSRAGAAWDRARDRRRTDGKDRPAAGGGRRAAPSPERSGAEAGPTQRPADRAARRWASARRSAPPSEASPLRTSPERHALEGPPEGGELGPGTARQTQGRADRAPGEHERERAAHRRASCRSPAKACRPQYGKASVQRPQRPRRTPPRPAGRSEPPSTPRPAASTPPTPQPSHLGVHLKSPRTHRRAYARTEDHTRAPTPRTLDATRPHHLASAR